MKNETTKTPAVIRALYGEMLNLIAYGAQNLAGFSCQVASSPRSATQALFAAERAAFEAKRTGSPDRVEAAQSHLDAALEAIEGAIEEAGPSASMDYLRATAFELAERMTEIAESCPKSRL